MTAPRTSRSHPIRLDLLPLDLAGAVGLTLAPGKHAASKSGAPWARDLAEDLDRLVEAHRVRVLVCLLEDAELAALRIPELVREAERRGLEVLRLPLPDGGVPPEPDVVRPLVVRVLRHARAGRAVAIHCAGGLGRAGTIAGCLLTDVGLSPQDALRTLARVRGPRCPENALQRRFVHDYAARRARDRVTGAVLGAAIGDAMGHPTEFLGLDEIHRRFGPDGVQDFALYWGEGEARFAPYTDDTQMAEAVARGLLDTDRADLDRAMQAIARRFVAWSEAPQGGHRAPGNACLRGCRALAGGAPWHAAGGPEDGGCGSVMRAYPFGIVFGDDLERAEAWAVAHSALTHRHPIALAAAGAMAVGVARALRGDAPEAIATAMIAAARRQDATTADMMARAAAEARDGTRPQVTLQRLQGWAAHEAIAAAVYLFLRHPDDPRGAILEGANTDGDSDSLATLAGALVGARNGAAALPEAWVQRIERRDALTALARRLADVTPRQPVSEPPRDRRSQPPRDDFGPS